MTDGDGIVRVIAIVMALIMVTAGLRRRRMRGAQGIKLALSWIGIIVGGWAIVSLAAHLR